MAVGLSELAYEVRTLSAETAHPIKLSHAQQLTAAAVGYKTLASYQASAEETDNFESAAHVVLDPELLADRAKSLGVPWPEEKLVQLIAAAFARRVPEVRTYSSASDLVGHLQTFVEEAVESEGSVQVAMDGAAHIGVDEVYMPLGRFTLEDVPPPGDSLNVDVSGHVWLSLDPDRGFTGGPKVHVDAYLVLERLGRASYVEPQVIVDGARLDYSAFDPKD